MLHLPTYDEVKNLPRDPPPYSYVIATGLPQTRIGPGPSSTSCPGAVDSNMTGTPPQPADYTPVDMGAPPSYSERTPTNSVNSDNMLPHSNINIHQSAIPSSFTPGSAEELSEFFDSLYMERPQGGRSDQGARSQGHSGNRWDNWGPGIAAQAGPATALVGLILNRSSGSSRNPCTEPPRMRSIQTGSNANASEDRCVMYPILYKTLDFTIFGCHQGIAV